MGLTVAGLWRWIMKDLVEVIAKALVDHPDEVASPKRKTAEA